MRGKSYFNYIQPTVVKASDNEDIPSNLQNKYFVNVNIVGIKYFVDNFILVEGENGDYMYMYTNDHHRLVYSPDGTEELIDIPRVYLTITKEFCESQVNFSEWLLKAIADNTYFLTGTDNFKPGVDYYINAVLREYLYNHEDVSLYNNSDVDSFTLHNYLDRSFSITKWWSELSDEEARLTNFDYFHSKNEAADRTNSEEALLDFTHTFFEILDQNAEVSDDDMLKLNNQIYKRVIEFYLNYGSDCATTALSMILGSMTNKSVEGVSSSCGCSSGSSNSSSSPTDNISCLDIYKNAMFEWLIKMLSDVDFYKDFMYFQDLDGELYPNDGLLDQLTELVEDLLASDINTGRGKGTSSKSIYGHCVCGSSSVKQNGSASGSSSNGGSNGSGFGNGGTGAGSDADNRNTLALYLQLLYWVKEGCIDNNVNKIRVIGEKFASILPSLTFA